MTVTLIVQTLEAIADIMGRLLPMFEQAKSVLSQNDAGQVHAALARAEAATAALRPQVDAALAKAAQN